MNREIITFKDKDIYDRELILLSVASLADIFPLPARKDSHYQLFLAMDGHNEIVGDLGNIPKQLIEEGLAYLCSWGPDCSRVHDIFDEASVQIEIETGNDRLIMTTWHEDDTLDEALWFLVYCAVPDEILFASCRTSYIVSVANPEWTLEITKALSDVNALSDRVAG